MYIDTESANKRSSRPNISVAAGSSRYDDASTPLLEAFAGQDAPPTYLEATSPGGLYTSWPTYEEGVGFMSISGRRARNRRSKEEQYIGRSRREQCLRSKWLRRAALIMFLLILAALFAEVVTSIATAGKKESVLDTSLSPLQSSNSKPSVTPLFDQPAKGDDSSGAVGSSNPKETTRPDGSSQSPESSRPKDSNDKDSSNEDADTPHLITVPWPESTSEPPKPTPAKPDFPIRWPSTCGREFLVKTEEYDFGTTKELSIQEAIHQRDNHYKRVEGWIHITKAPEDQAAGTIQAKLSYAVSPHVDVEKIQHSVTKTGITIGDASFMDGLDGVGKGSACLGMSIVLYVAPGVALDTLDVAATHMGMQIHKDVDLSINNLTSISLTRGTIQAAALKSRETHLRTISGSISGKYSLYNLLAVTSKSGSVNINVEPEAMENGHATPAIFSIDAQSSSIRVDFERNNIPDRDYQTMIATTAGSVDGRFIHGSRTEIRSAAGFVAADLLPFRSGEYPSEIYTHTHSGQTNLTLQSPYKAKKMPLKGLISTHKTTSGALNVMYPDEWVGFVDGTSLSGALHLQGNDLVLVDQNDAPGQNHVEARKGGEGSLLAFDTMNGGCDVTIGKV